jgi:hypothetical protein
VSVRIPPERLEAIINEAARLPSVRLFVFTGGECFLIPELDERIAQVTRLGLRSRCVTNGYWAFSPERARARVKTLSAAGLKEINFSSGRFHSKYVPVERIVFAASATADAGILTLITVETCEQEDDSADRIYEHPALRTRIDSGEILFQRNVWIDNEGEAPLTHDDQYNRFANGHDTGCKTALDVLAVTPTQSLVACCGLHLERIPELHIGSVADVALDTLVKAAADDFIKIWLHVTGPERIYRFAQSKDPSVQLPDRSAHPCETCLKLFRDKRALEVLREHYPAVEEEVVRLYAAGILFNRLDAALARKIPLAA